MKSRILRFQSTVAELSPEQVALLLAVGLALGVFPIMGIPTLLCLLAAYVLRLNVAALQVLNSVSSPLQLALLVPLERAGARIAGVAVSGSAASRLGILTVHALTGWVFLCVPGAVLLYFVLLLSMRRRRAAIDAATAACEMAEPA